MEAVFVGIARRKGTSVAAACTVPDAGRNGHGLRMAACIKPARAHPPFQIDGNFGVMAGILAMLVSEDGTLLPALPKELDSGKLTGYRLKDGKILDFEWKDGCVVWQNLRTADEI